MLINDLTLMDIEDNKEKVTFNFVTDNNELYEVVWRKQVFNRDTNAWEDDPDKYQQVEDWCKQYFDLDLKDIEKAIGVKKDIYAYPTFCSLWEVDSKFEPQQEGKILDATITDIQMLKDCIYLRFSCDDKTYGKRYKFTKQIGEKFYVSPQIKQKRLEEFEKNYKVPFEQKNDLIGVPIKVEVKKAFGKYLYPDIKAL